MMGLSEGRKSFRIGLAVLIQYRSVTDTQPASHVAVAITLNAQASSLEIVPLYSRYGPQCIVFVLDEQSHGNNNAEISNGTTSKFDY